MREIFAAIGRVLAGFLLFAAPAGAVVVDLHGADVTGKNLRLGDVALISGVPEDVSRRLQDVVLGFTPPPGQSRVISAEMVRMALLREGFLPQSIVVRGEKELLIRRTGRKLTESEISEAVLEAIALPASILTSIVRISNLPMIPVGPVEFRVTAPLRTQGSFFVPVEVRVGDDVVKINVTLKSMKMGSVVVAARKLERGATVTDADLAIETRDLYEMPHDVIENIGSVVGSVVTRAVTAGSLLTKSAIEEKTLVRRGDRVRILVRFGSIELSSPGEAVEQGGLGAIVKVRNMESRKIVSGRVTGAGEVIVLE